MKIIKKHLERILILSIISSFVVAFYPVQSYSKENKKDERRIVVSLGDSYSSGEGIEEFYGQEKKNKEKVKDPDWLAHRSKKSWPGQLKLQKNSKSMTECKDDTWYFVASSGATVDNLRHSQKKDYCVFSDSILNNEIYYPLQNVISGSEKLKPQLKVFDNLEKKPDYVTLTLGGNDADFAEIIKKACLNWSFFFPNGLRDKLDDVWVRFFEDGGIRDDLKYAYKDIEDKAGKEANIIVAGYPQLISENGGKGQGYVIEASEAKVINENVTKFNNAIKDIVQVCQREGMKIHFVPVEEAFRGKGAYSEDELINGVELTPQAQDINISHPPSCYSIHPNEKGAQIYAKCVQNKIYEIEGIESFDEQNRDNNKESVEFIPEDAVEFKGHKYCLYKGARCYDEICDYCTSKGGYPATITSQEENGFLFKYMKEKGYTNAYFGLSDSDNEGEWKWHNGEQLNYTNWHRNKPSAENEDEDYAMFYYKYDDGTWNDGDFGKNAVNDKGLGINSSKDELVFICEWGDYEKEKQQISGKQNIVLTLDTSESMSGTPIDETKRAAKQFIKTILNEDTGIGLVEYSSDSNILSGVSKSSEILQEKVEKCIASGSTNMEAGLRDSVFMLNGTNSKKRIIVLMSDGEPNEGLEGENLIAYANEIKNSGISIYTVGFFDDHSIKTERQLLMEKLASPGCHYEVATADELVNFFNDIAEQINGQKYIYIRVACPVDVSVTYDGETLDSSQDSINRRTEFGTLTFEDVSSDENENSNKIKILRLKEGPNYDVKIVGNGQGIMNYTIGFMNDDGEYDDFRKFEKIRITGRTVIDSKANISDESILNIDEDGDGKYDLKLSAQSNGYGEEVKNLKWIIYLCGGILVFLIFNMCIIRHLKKRKEKR